MSAKFRSNRKYRVSSGNYPKSAGGRPITASSSASHEETYHSDFEALDDNGTENEQSNLFFTGESIDDKLNLGKEFANIEGSLLEEDEYSISKFDMEDEIEDEEVKQLLFSPPKQPLSSRKLEGSYEENYSPPYSADLYSDDQFEVASPSQPSSRLEGKKQQISDEEDHQTVLPNMNQVSFPHASTTDNTLAEYSSLTLANSSVLSNPVNNNNLSNPTIPVKRKKKSKGKSNSSSSTPRRKQNHGSINRKEPPLPTIDSPRVANNKNKFLPEKNEKKKNQDQETMPTAGISPLYPTRPQSHPSQSMETSNPRNTFTRRNVSAGDSRRPASPLTSHPARQTKSLDTNDDSSSQVLHSRIDLEADSSGEEGDHYNNHSSSSKRPRLPPHPSLSKPHIPKQKSSSRQIIKSKRSSPAYEKISITTEGSTIGKPSLQTFSYCNTSKVVSTGLGLDLSMPQSELQKLYRQSLHQIKVLTQQNQSLQSQLDLSNHQEIIQHYQYQLSQRDQQIQSLQSELQSTKSIIRQQEKSLLQYSHQKDREFEVVHHQEKDLEVLYAQLKKVKQQMFTYKEKGLQQELTIDELKEQLQKQRQRLQSWKKKTELLTQEKEAIQQFLFSQQSEVSNTTEKDPSEKMSPLPRPTATTVQMRSSIDSHLSDLQPSQQQQQQQQLIEKNYQSQIKILTKDLQQVRQQYQQSEQQSQKLLKELSKRESFIQYQSTVLKTIRQSFQLLSENSDHLLQGSILFGRDRKPPPPPPEKKVSIPSPIEPPIEKKKGLLVEEEERDEGFMEEEKGLDFQSIVGGDSLDIPEKALQGFGALLKDDNEEEEIKQENHRAFFITEEEETEKIGDKEVVNDLVDD